MGRTVMHVLILVSAAALCLGQSVIASHRIDCHTLVNPFEDRQFHASSLDQCETQCFAATAFRCQSITYSRQKRLCTLSDRVRDEPLLPSGDSDYVYLERPKECGVRDLTNRIVSCSDSSHYSPAYTCQEAYGGTEATGAHNEWVVQRGRGSGEWLQVNFATDYLVSGVRILHRCKRTDQVSTWRIEAEHDVSVEKTRTCGGTSSISDCSGSGNDWFSIDTPHCFTSYVRFVVVGTCGSNYLGIRELEVLGYVD